MSTSAIETMRSAIVTELKTINKGSTYRNTLEEVYERADAKVTQYPSAIFLLHNEMTLLPKDQACSTFDIDIPFSITLAVAAYSDTTTISELTSVQDSLIHDVFKMLSGLYTKYITGSVRWNIRTDQPIKVSPLIPFQAFGNNDWEFMISGIIHLRYLSSSFE